LEVHREAENTFNGVETLGKEALDECSPKARFLQCRNDLRAVGRDRC